MADDPKNDETPSTDEKNATPPWGDNFDAERAWALIQGLRGDKETLKKERDDARAEASDFRTAAEKTGEDRDKALKAATERAEKAERDLAISKHNLPADVLEEFGDYLTGTTEEVDAKAARLAARLAPKPAEGDEGKETEESSTEEIPGKPKPALRPGHGGEQDAPFDPKAIADAARARF